MYKNFFFVKFNSLILNKNYQDVFDKAGFFKNIEDFDNLEMYYTLTFFRKKHHRIIKAFRINSLEIFIKKYEKNLKEAENEWKNMILLWKKGFPTSTPVFYLKKSSFILLGTEKIPGKLILEIMKENPEKKLEMLETLAKTLASFHREGLFHQDCYLNHFYFDEKNKLLYIIDVSRVLERPFLKFYYQVKDLSQLKYSFLEYFPETWEKEWKIFFEAYHKFWGKSLKLMQQLMINLKFWKISKHTEKLMGKK